MVRLSSTLVAVAAVFSGAMGATPPCGVEPSGGFAFDKICNDECGANISFVIGDGSEERQLGPGTLPASQYRVAAFYFGHQS
mmetsp:Transcript_10551/g.14957  ORF Transcript_10551/g.14957 Transcript_10551/m.14957 type:complete len:82 (-) Transcript_10551:309-554(-)